MSWLCWFGSTVLQRRNQWFHKSISDNGFGCLDGSCFVWLKKMIRYPPKLPCGNIHNSELALSQMLHSWTTTLLVRFLSFMTIWGIESPPECFSVLICRGHQRHWGPDSTMPTLSKTYGSTGLFISQRSNWGKTITNCCHSVPYCIDNGNVIGYRVGLRRLLLH